MPTFPTFPFRAVLELTDEIPIAPPGQVEMERTSLELLAELLGAGSGGGAVDSVFGRTGVVAAASGDYTADQVDYGASDVGAALDALIAALGGKQPSDATLTALAALAWAAGVQVIAFTAADTVTLLTVGAGAGNLLDKAAGDSLYQPVEATLTALAGLTIAADKFIYGTGPDAVALGDITAFARTILDDADAAAVKTTLGLAAVATSGSASDLGSGTLGAARLPAFAGGDVTSSAGSAVLSIGSNKVTSAMLQSGVAVANLGFTPLDASTTSVQDGYFTTTKLKNATSGKYLSLANSDTTAAANRTLSVNLGNTDRALNFTGGTGLTVNGTATITGANTGDQTITLTGDVGGSGTGSFAATIAANAVTLAKMAQMATASFLGRTTASTGNVEVLSSSQARGVLGLATTDGPTFKTLNLTTTTLFDGITLTCTEDSATASPLILFKRITASPAIGDSLGVFQFNGCTDTSLAGGINYGGLSMILENVTNGSESSSFRFTSRRGATPTEECRFGNGVTTQGGNSGQGAGTFNGSAYYVASNVVIDANRHTRLRSYTVATLPTASPATQVIYVSDGTANKRQAVSDGTNWRWPDGAIVS